jgi:hypothetical protein
MKGKRIKPKANKLYRIEVIIALFLFINIMITPTYTTYFSGLFFISVFYSILLIALSLAYAMIIRFGESRAYALASHLIFAASIALFIYLFFAEPSASLSLVFASIIRFVNLAYGILFFLLVFFLASFCTYFMSKGNRKVGVPLLLILIFVLVLHIVSWMLQGSSINDETALSFLSVQLVSMGMNPYATSMAQTLYSAALNGSIKSLTLTTSNTFPAFMDYPALFFLSSAPFYIFSQFTFYNLAYGDSAVEFSLFLMLLLFAMTFNMEERDLLAPKFDFIILAPLFLFFIPSVNDLLMGALLIMCYSRINSRYAWLFFGLAISIQEQLWLPVLFLLAYSFNNYGFRKGAYNLAGALAVFLAINSYFIVQGPVQFFSQIVGPLSMTIIPNSSAPIGYLLIAYYHIPLSAIAPVFIFITAIMLLLYLYFNKKELIGLFGLIPFLFLSHALTTYYPLYIFLFAFSIYSIRKGEEKEGYLYTELRRRKGVGYVITGLAILAVLLTSFYVYSSHVYYENAFNISVTDQQIYTLNNNTYYSADIVYNDIAVNSVYLGFLGSSTSNFSVNNEYGYFNESIIPRPQNCSTISCFIDPNIVQLQRNASVQHVSGVIRSPNNESLVTSVTLLIYNGTYFYRAPSTSYSGQAGPG